MTKTKKYKGGNYLNNIELVSILGTGLKGTVFQAEEKNKPQYALKVEQIMKDDLNNSESLMKRELEFSEHLSTKYPHQFMKILVYQNNTCDYIHELTPERWKLITNRMYEYYQNLFKSEFCSIKLTNKVDLTLHDIIYELSNKDIIYEIFIQIVYIAYLIQLNGFYHRDFKPKNIGINYTENDYIHILNKKNTNKWIFITSN